MTLPTTIIMNQKKERDRRAAEVLFDIWVDDEKVQEDEEGNFCIA